MNRILTRVNKRVGLGGAAAILLVVSLIGQLLGFLRYKVVNANFDTLGPQSTDAYFAAFKIPDFFFFTVAAGALGVAFMPILAEHLERGDKKGVWELANSLLNLLMVAMFFVGLILLVFAEPILRLITDLPPEQLRNAVTIMRIISFNPLLFAISGILTSVQQNLGRFFFFAIAPVFYNAAILISVYVFRNNIGLVGLGYGALIGAVLQLLVVFFGLQGTGYRWSPRINWKNKDFRLILKQLPPRSIDQGADSINSIVETGLATRLGVGNISFYENAYILHTTPILLIGTTIATAAFPGMTDRLAQGRYDLFRKEFLVILRAMIWIALPVIVVCYFARAYFARLIFAKNAPEIALIFGYLSGAILFRIIFAIISRWFYAQKDTRTPLIVSLFAITLNIFLAYTLSKPESYGIAGLAMAQSIVAAFEVMILGLVMLVRDHKLFDANFVNGIIRIISVTGFSIVAAFVMISLLPLQATDRGFLTLGFKLGAISLVTFLAHLGISSLFGLEEPQPVIAKIRQFILKPIKLNW